MYKYFYSINVFGDTYTYLNNKYGFSGSSASSVSEKPDIDLEVSEVLEEINTILVNQNIYKPVLELYS